MVIFPHTLVKKNGLLIGVETLFKTVFDKETYIF